MKLASFIDHAGGQPRPGVVLGEEIVDVSDACQGAGLLALLEAGADALQRAQAIVDSGEHRHPLGDVTLHAPLRPRKFFAIGLNYADHVAESGLETPKNLTVFYKAPTSVTGPYDPVERPAVSRALDYEGELGIVIGRRCRHVRAAEAVQVIAGYTIVNDISVRDWQVMTPQWSLGKSFDTHGPIGPYVVTADELSDPHALRIRTYVNGEKRQDSNTSNLIFNCFEIVEIISQACTLEPGDLIATGTPSGVAAGIEGQPWLIPGDQVEVQIDRLGTIRNTIVEEDAPAGFVTNPTWVSGRA